MSAEGKAQFLTEKLDRQIDSFKKWSANNKKKAFLVKMFATFFSAATTILLGLQGIEGTKFLHLDSTTLVKNLALILSALVTLFNSWDAFFNHRSLWINFTNTANQLRAIRGELQYLAVGGTEKLDEDEIDRLYTKYQSILDSTNLQWMKLRDETPNKGE